MSLPDWILIVNAHTRKENTAGSDAPSRAEHDEMKRLCGIES